MAWGVGGVPGLYPGGIIGEGALIGGYDGDVLLIQLYCGVERLPAESYVGRPGVDEYGYTAIMAKEALNGTDGIFIPISAIESTDPKTVLRDVLTNIPKRLTFAPTGGRVSEKDQYTFGKAAFTKWADILLNDSIWRAAADCCEEALWKRLCSAFCSVCTSAGAFDGDRRAVDWLRRAEAMYSETGAISSLLPVYENVSAECVRDVPRYLGYPGRFLPAGEKSECMNSALRARVRFMGWENAATAFWTHSTTKSDARYF